MLLKVQPSTTAQEKASAEGVADSFVALDDEVGGAMEGASGVSIEVPGETGAPSEPSAPVSGGTVGAAHPQRRRTRKRAAGVRMSG
jgi:hypothetical protein